jgi:hypothetical protein
MHRDGDREAKAGEGGPSLRAAGASKSGVTVSVTGWSGRQLQDTVSEGDEAGLLLDPDYTGDGRQDCTVLPWSSVERLDIAAVAHRRVEFLRG